MAKDKEKGHQDCDLGEKEEEEEPRSIEIVKRWTTMIKGEKLPRRFYMYILLLFAGFFTLLLQFGGIKVSSSGLIFSFVDQTRASANDIQNPPSSPTPRRPKKRKKKKKKELPHNSLPYSHF